jgi:FAD:protein FMN transferase
VLTCQCNRGNAISSRNRKCRRNEHKFSRYRDDNIVHRINHSAGVPLQVDEETAALLDFAAQCYELSDGRFDITSGILRQVWRFDGSNLLPTTEQVQSLLGHIGWSKLTWQRPWLTLPAGMELVD